MRCTNHSKKESTGSCIECGKLFCDQCIILVGRKRYCQECASEILSEEGELISNKSKGIVITQQTTNIQNSFDEEDIESPKMSETTKKVLKYSVSIFCGLLTLGLLSEGEPLALFFFFMFLIWLPPVENWVNKKWDFILPNWIKVTLTIILIILLGALEK